MGIGMIDRIRFMEILTDLADYAEVNGGVLTKTEVEESFQDMELDESQYDLIYRYLFEKKITIQGIRLENLNSQAVSEQDKSCAAGREASGETDFSWNTPEFGQESLEEDMDFADQADEKYGKSGSRQQACRAEGSQKEQSRTAEQLGEADSVYLKMYLEELEGLPKVSEAERLEMAVLLLEGRDEVLPALLNASLYQVVELARIYSGRGVFLEDLIQEGNIGLMQVLEELKGKKKQEEPLLYIKESVQYAMEQYIDSQMIKEDEEEQVVAKLALLHEAAKVLAKENGVLPSARELSEYTRIPEAEILDMVSLSKDIDFLQSERREE